MAKPTVQTIALTREGAIAVHLDRHVHKMPRRLLVAKLAAWDAARPAPRVDAEPLPF